jgi:MFS family permease
MIGLYDSARRLCVVHIIAFVRGHLGSIPSILGAQVLMDIFFLHERGRAVTTFHMCFLLGTVAGPTFGGFVVQHVTWPFEFWWTVALQCAVAILGMPNCYPPASWHLG